jgi:transcription initiation factor TFIIH subunit 1
MFRESIAQVLPKKAGADTPTKPPTKKPVPPKPNGTLPVSFSPSISSLFGMMTEEDVMQRAKMLASNKELQTLHEQLVKGGVITEEEFWETRKSKLENESRKTENQPTGMSTVLSSDVRPSSETCNAVHYKITPQIIHQIFIQFPVVQRAYLDNVPTKMSEKEFWIKYFQSQFFHRDRLKGAVVPGPGDELFSKYASEVDKDKDPVLINENSPMRTP